MGSTLTGCFLFFCVGFSILSYCHSCFPKKSVISGGTLPGEIELPDPDDSLDSNEPSISNPTVTLTVNLKEARCDALIRNYHAGNLGATEIPELFRAAPNRPNCRFVNTADNPIQSYGYKTIEYGGQTYCVPTMVYAQLTQTCSRVGRSFDGTRWERQMLAMDARGYRQGDPRIKDERGHLIAAQVCGPAAWFNLAPQSPALNAERNRLSYSHMGWYGMERKWADLVSRGRLINVYIFVDYVNDALRILKNRPKGFRVCSDAGDDDYFNNSNFVIDV